MRIGAHDFAEQVEAQAASADLVKMVFSGRLRGSSPRSPRVDVRPVLIAGQRMLQAVRTIEAVHTSENHELTEAPSLVRQYLAEGFSHVTTTTTSEMVEYRVAKSGDVFAARTPRSAEADLAHDRVKQRMLDSADPLLVAIGISDEAGRIKSRWRDKYRQVDDFLRIFSSTLSKAIDAGQVPTPSQDAPLRIADLGCGHAYLTFGAQAWLERSSGWPADIVGVDVRQASMERNIDLARALGIENMTFVASAIDDYSPAGDVDVALALHACDTATDDALAWAVRHRAKVILSVPCCHHDVQRQIAGVELPAPLAMAARYGILRERLGDLLTDAARAAVLRQCGYRVDVIEFVSGEHTPRNLMIRGVFTGADPDPKVASDLAALRRVTGIRQSAAAQLLDE